MRLSPYQDDLFDQLSRYPYETRKAEVMIPRTLARAGFQGRSLHRQHAFHVLAESGELGSQRFHAHPLSGRCLHPGRFTLQERKTENLNPRALHPQPLSRR